MFGRPNAGSHENGRAAERSGGKNNFPRRQYLSIKQLHADSTLAFKNHAVHFSAALDREVGACTHRGCEIRHSRIDAHAVDHVKRIRSRTVLTRTVEIRYVLQAEGFRAFHEG